MAAIVFIWKPHVDNFGHAALHVHNGPYISWWPSGTPASPSAKGSMFGSQAAASSMRSDKASEGNRIPDWAGGPIKGLDEDKIKLVLIGILEHPQEVDPVGTPAAGYKIHILADNLTFQCPGKVPQWNNLVLGIL